MNLSVPANTAPRSAARTSNSFLARLVPRHIDATATVTFVRLEQQTYAVTAGHVITTFDRQSAEENQGR